MSQTDPRSTESVVIAGIEIPRAEQTPLVMALLAVVQRLERENAELREEIQRLKGTTQRPKIQPSRLLKPPVTPPSPPGKRPGSAKRSKTKGLKIDENIVLQPDVLPPDAKLEGYHDFVVQDLIVKTHVTRYRRAAYRLPDGRRCVAALPPGLTSHFGVGLRQYVLLQTHQNHVTQGRLREELREWGIDISAGQIANILLEGHEAFHAEKDELLPTARQVSDHLHCDDTSARHCGRPAVCTHIGNELFASFTTTDSKSRLNFLRLLCQPEERYRWCEEAQQSLEWLGAGKQLLRQLADQPDASWLGTEAWEQQLDRWNLTKPDHRTLVSEAALCGTLLTESWYAELGLVSDDAPQFKVFGFIHGLCWVHGERKIDRLIPLIETHRRAKEKAQETFWGIYESLKQYRFQPTPDARQSVEQCFSDLCQTRTGYPDLNDALRLLYAKRDEFLAVLEHPHLPLHNNLSESDIREYARIRKISAGTRSDPGRRCRDTFLSLKKTCRKLGLSFCEYLQDRLSGTGLIPRLSELMRKAAAATATPVTETG
jgi:hypothetical protein